MNFNPISISHGAKNRTFAHWLIVETTDLFKFGKQKTRESKLNNETQTENRTQRIRVNNSACQMSIIELIMHTRFSLRFLLPKCQSQLHEFLNELRR